MNTKIVKLTGDELDMLYNNSAYTITGAGGNLDEWTKGINKIFAEQAIAVVKKKDSLNY